MLRVRPSGLYSVVLSLWAKYVLIFNKLDVLLVAEK